MVNLHARVLIANDGVIISLPIFDVVLGVCNYWSVFLHIDHLVSVVSIFSCVIWRDIRIYLKVSQRVNSKSRNDFCCMSDGAWRDRFRRTLSSIAS
ncbi:MAG TPA: hypothetical protein IGS40_11285 [Trichormus sp. M33_DOE_039]|nr:hypothetical protein [Trichormus sp. M33_DOE_039]